MTVQGSSQREYLMDVLTTDDVPRQQRLEYWTDAICEVFVHLECDAEQLHGGDSSATSCATGWLIFVSHRLIRRPSGC
jgi:hypothetical protein